MDPSTGGPAVTTFNALVATARKGIDVTFAFPCSDLRAVEDDKRTVQLRDEGVTVVPVPLTRSLGRYAQTYGISRQLWRTVHRFARQVDVVHSGNAWCFSTLAAARAAKQAERPFVLSPHETLTRFDMASATNRFLKAMKRPLKKYYTRVADAVAFASDLEMRDSGVDGHRPPEWVTMYHPVYDERQDHVDSRVFMTGREDPFRLGYLGRFHPKKNIEMILNALARLPDCVILSIAGGGDRQYENQLRNLAEKLGVNRRIKWFGFIVGDEKEKFFRSIDLLVMPSAYECFGRAAAEAMSAGTPVLVSECTGVAEVVGRHDAGIIVSTDSAEIAEAVSVVFDDSSRLTTLSERGLRAAHENFSFAAHGENLSRLYEALVAR